MKIVDLRAQNLRNPIGLQSQNPVFSWKLESDENNRKQTAYRIVAATSLEKLTGECYDAWDSGKVESPKSYGIVYGGKALCSMQRVYWRVKVWDRDGEETAFSDAAYFETGLLNRDDWKAKWISAETKNAPILSKEFIIGGSKTVASARLYISGLGLFEAHVNGKALGNSTYFNPGESDARKTVYYCTYDITEMLNPDNNAVSFILGNGQYANYRIHRQAGRYYKTDDARSAAEVAGMFGRVKGIAQVVITYTDGTRDLIGTDDSWVYAESPITENSWYGGEDYDAALEIEGWDDSAPAIPRSSWGKASLVPSGEIPSGELIGREFEPIAIQKSDTIRSENITVTKHSEKDGYTAYLVDMGRNGAGFPEITVTSDKAGQIIRMYPAETDTFDGFDGHINQASCTQSASNGGELIYDTYITKGVGRETWHPRFCYHGYRYLEVVVPSDIKISNENFVGYILRTNNGKNGSFASSNGILNQINVLTERSIESNMYSTFTDCPQIEKLGWLETAGLMFDSMAHTYDIGSWIPKLIRDMIDSQQSNGRIAAIAPEFYRIGGLHEDLNWNGSVIFTAWQYYEAYGDKRIFSDINYTAMKKYMEYLENCVAKNNLITSGQMGEWGEMTKYGTTPVALVETTAYYRLAVTMKKISEVRKDITDAAHYRELAKAIRTAFHENSECYNERWLYGNGTQSGYGCVLYSGIAPYENREEALNRLISAIESADYHLTSGEIGLRQVFSSLAEGGRSDVIYKMVTNDSMPSYKYFADKGLTTLPEYWNFEELWYGMSRSLNHAMMGHVKEWFTKYLAGISAAKPGYDAVDIKPSVTEELTSVCGAVNTPHGIVTSAWDCDSHIGEFTLKLSIPIGVTANVYIPVIRENQAVFLGSENVGVEIINGGRYMLVSAPVGSGEYVFTATGRGAGN